MTPNNGTQTEPSTKLNGKTVTWEDFGDEQAELAHLLLELYDGEQKEYVEEMLNGDLKGYEGAKRKEWKARGMVAAIRNIVKPIVEKSNNLFNQPPTLELYVGKTIVQSETFTQLMDSIDWHEFFQNVSSLTRLLKTTIVLQQQYIPENVLTVDAMYKYNQERGDAVLPIILHRGNTVVKTDITGRIITELAYLTSSDDCDEEVWEYRHITPTEVSDWRVTNYGGTSTEEMINIEPNTYGFVPATFFYDNTKPRTGVWNEVPEDIINFQLLYDLHLTDTHFAIAWQKAKTLFTNTTILEPDDNTYIRTVDQANDYSFDSLTTGFKPSSNIGGLGEIVTLKNDDQGNAPLIKFDGPTTDLSALQDILDKMLYDIASDWSVNMKFAGQGSATSGFQLVVEEIDNLTLREKRAQYFSSGMRKFYEVLSALYPELPKAVLYTTFAEPSLPVDNKAEEDIWSIKINEGRASRLDYMMEVKGMTKEEAIAKLKEIDADRNPPAENVQTTL
jgi:hypothetical protein